MINKKQKEVMEKWREEHGCCEFDYKEYDIILPDGGQLVIEKEKYMAHKIIGYKKIPGGGCQVIFSKKATVPSEDYKAIIWMEELDELIVYLQSMKHMLNKIGIKTDTSLQWLKRLKIKMKKEKITLPKINKSKLKNINYPATSQDLNSII